MRRLPLLFSVCLAPVAGAQTLEDAFRDNPIPDLFAALMNVTLSEEVAAATFRVDNHDSISDDTTFSTFRVPWFRDLDVGAGEDRLRLEAVIGLLVADDHLFIDTPSGRATAREDWTAAGFLVGAGWNHPVGSGWALRPGLALGLAYIDNSTTYNAAGQQELAPVLDGLLTNWDAWAASGTASLTFGRERDPARFDAGLTARWALTRTRVFGATHPLQEGSDTSQFGVARGEIGGPSAWFRRGEPVEWDAFLGYAGLYDVDRGTLGFDEVTELGAGFTLRLSQKLPRLRLGGAWLTGPDIRGWSLGLGLGR